MANIVMELVIGSPHRSVSISVSQPSMDWLQPSSEPVAPWQGVQVAGVPPAAAEVAIERLPALDPCGRRFSLA
jgi:hypothetical protein